MTTETVIKSILAGIEGKQIDAVHVEAAAFLGLRKSSDSVLTVKKS
jgi:hypothetical protein